MKDTQFLLYIDVYKGSTSSYAFCCPSYNEAGPEGPDYGRKIAQKKASEESFSVYILLCPRCLC